MSDEDRQFIAMVSKGMPRSKAFKLAYPNHQSVKRFMDVKSPEEKKKAQSVITQAAKTKLQSKYIYSAMVEYQDRMNMLADKALDVAEEIMVGGRSEMVRGDLAKEFIRHRVGTPVTKVAVQEEKTVYLTFSDPNEKPSSDNWEDDIPEGEVVEDQVVEPNIDQDFEY